MQDRNLTTIFVHIPKTAGTTVQNILLRNHAYRKTYIIREANTTIKDFEDLPASERNKYRLIMGHMPWGQHSNIAGPSSYFTMLRDPIERIISTYYFLINNPKHYLHKIVTENNLDLKGYVLSRYSQDTDNFQVRCLSGAWYHVPYGELGASYLDSAKRNIEEYFDVVGITEYFDESLLMLQRHYGWLVPWYTRDRVNAKRPRKQRLDHETLAVIREHNQLDIELYSWAEHRFTDQVTALGEPFASKLASFRKISPYFAPLAKMQQAMRKYPVRTWLSHLLHRQHS